MARYLCSLQHLAIFHFRFDIAESGSNTHKTENISLAHTITGYWSILNNQWVVHGVGDSVKAESTEKKLCLNKTGNLQHQIEKVLSLWRFRKEHLDQHKRFYMDPSHCGFCSYAAVCRKHDSQIEQQIINTACLTQHKEDSNDRH